MVYFLFILPTLGRKAGSHILILGHQKLPHQSDILLVGDRLSGPPTLFAATMGFKQVKMAMISSA